MALRAFLPPAGQSLLEVGAGFGRLADEYAAFERVALLDASEVHVASARASLGGDSRIEVTLGDALALPYPTASFDAAVCVRVIHHFGDPAPLLAELARVVRPGGILVLEYANKRNLKSMARRLLRLQPWSPFKPGAVAYRAHHFDHSPLSVGRTLRAAGFRVERTRAVSLFRIPLLCRHLPLGLLTAAESLLQEPLGRVTPGPSVFVRAIRRGS